jgi:glyoxylase-like metal-dependent hydrolase (beta-lactamase superfamily II)
MKTHLAAATLVAALTAAPAAAATIEEIAVAMGTNRLDSLHISGEGKYYNVGQAFRAGGPWPEFRMIRYSRAEDYGAAGIAYDMTYLSGPNEQRRAGGLRGDRFWNLSGVPAGLPALQHDLATSPHGIVKAALAGKVAVAGASFEIARAGSFRAKATVNAENLVETVESWINNPVLGDMPVVTRFSDYKDFGGVMVPTQVTQTAGGLASFALSVADAKPNAGRVEVPADAPPPSAPGPVRLDKAADGVWFLTGGSHNSIAIEMADHVIVYEGPLGDARAGAVIEAVRGAIPGKPIRAVVVSHHHFDHSGGLRAFAAEGIAIAAPAAAAEFFAKAYAAPRTLAPDRLARSGREASFIVVGARHEFRDATRTFEVHELKGNPHAEGLMIGYLPKEKILMVADAFSPRQPITRTPDRLNPSTVNLWENVKRLELDVETVLPIHGRMVKVDELKLEVGAN